MMIDTISIIIATIALTISAITAWLTLFRRGTVRMTQPTTIFLGPDSPNSPKVFLRTLLYSTSKRGQIVESLFVKLHRGETTQTFNVWVYGDDSLARGSGLYVGEDGIACNHHFLLPEDGTRFEFLPGNYKFEVYALLVGRDRPLQLSVVNLSLSEQVARQLGDGESGAYFDWGPDSQRYHAHVRKRPQIKLPRFLQEDAS